MPPIDMRTLRRTFLPPIDDSLVGGPEDVAPVAPTPIQPGLGIPRDTVDSTVNKAISMGALRDVFLPKTTGDVPPPGEDLIELEGPPKQPLPGIANVTIEPSPAPAQAPDISNVIGPTSSQSVISRPAVGVQGTNTQADIKPVERPVEPPALNPPSEPLAYSTWRQGQEQILNNRDEELARANMEREELAAAERADVLGRATAVEIAAQREAQKRADELRNRREAARDELERRSDVLARAAEIRSTQRPGAGSRAAGRALLAISAGMGSTTAANLFNASLEQERNDERMDLERRRTDIDALTRSANLAGDVLGSLGRDSITETELDAAASLAREKVALRELEAKVAKMGPGDAKLKGEALISQLRRQSLENGQKLADKVMSDRLLFMKLNAVQKASTSAPPKGPEMPTRKEGQTDSQYRDAVENYVRQKDFYDRVTLPRWQAKSQQGGASAIGSYTRAGSTLSALGETAPALGTAVETVGTIPSQTREIIAKARAKITNKTSPKKPEEESTIFANPFRSLGIKQQNKKVEKTIKAGNSTAKIVPESTVKSRAQDLIDQERSQYDITAPPLIAGGQPFEIKPLPGKVPNIADPNTKSLNADLANTVTFTKKMTELATLVSDFNGKSLGEFLGSHLSSFSGLSQNSTKEEVKGALRNLLKSQVSLLQKQGVITEADAPRYEQMVTDDKLFGNDPSTSVAQIAAVNSYFGDGVADRLRVAGYDDKPFRDELGRANTLITALGKKPEKTDSAVIREGEKIAQNERDYLSALSPDQFDKVNLTGAGGKNGDFGPPIQITKEGKFVNNAGKNADLYAEFINNEREIRKLGNEYIDNIRDKSQGTRQKERATEIDKRIADRGKLIGRMAFRTTKDRFPNALKFALPSRWTVNDPANESKGFRFLDSKLNSKENRRKIEKDIADLLILDGGDLLNYYSTSAQNYKDEIAGKRARLKQIESGALEAWKGYKDQTAGKK